MSGIGTNGSDRWLGIERPYTQADIDDERVIQRRPAGGDAADHHRGLLGPVEQPSREAVAPLDLAEERLPVVGVPNRARRDRQRAGRLQNLELTPILGEAVPYAGDGDREKPTPLVDALPEPGDRQAADDLLEAPVLDVGDEQPGRVRAEVDRRDAGHLHRKEDAEPACTALCAVERVE